MCLCVRMFVSIYPSPNSSQCHSLHREPKPKMGYIVLRLCHYHPIRIFSLQPQCYYSVAVLAKIYLIISW